MPLQCWTRERNDGSQYINCKNNGGAAPARTSNARVRRNAPLKPRPKPPPPPNKPTGVMAKKIAQKIKEKEDNVKLVTGMVAKQRKAAAKKKIEDRKNTGIMGKKIAEKVAQKKQAAEVKQVVAKVKAKKAEKDFKQARADLKSKVGSPDKKATKEDFDEAKLLIKLGLNKLPPAKTEKNKKFLSYLKENRPIKIKQDPRKVGKSFDRFQKYKSAKTVVEMIKKGGTFYDLINDVEKGIITVGN